MRVVCGQPLLTLPHLSGSLQFKAAIYALRAGFSQRLLKTKTLEENLELVSTLEGWIGGLPFPVLYNLTQPAGLYADFQGCSATAKGGDARPPEPYDLPV